MNLFVAAFGFGLVSMSVIAIAAVGFTMQFGITNMINLAYGEVMISSAYLAYYMNKAGISIWIGMVAGALFGAVFSFLLNRVVYAPFMRKGTANLGMVIVSLAVSLMISNLLLPIVGYYSVSYQEDAGKLIRLGSIVLTRDQIIVIGIAVVLMLGSTRCSPTRGWARRCGRRPPIRPWPATAEYRPSVSSTRCGSSRARSAAWPGWLRH